MQLGIHYFAYMKYKYRWPLSLQTGRCDANEVIVRRTKWNVYNPFSSGKSAIKV